MANDYYNRVTNFVPDTSVRSNDLDQELDAIVAGFDKLGDPTRLGNGASLNGTDTGSANNYVFSNGSAITTLIDGQLITFVPTNTSTGASVISYNGGDNYSIVRNSGNAIQSGDLIEGVPVILLWDEANSRWVHVGATAQQCLESFRPNVTTSADTAYTLSTTDEGSVILFTSSSSVSVTAPNDAAGALPTGFIVHLHQDGTGQVTVVAGGGVTLLKSNSAKTRTQYSSLSLIKVAANTYKIIGDQEV